MRKFIFNGTNILTQAGKVFYPDRGKVLLAGLLVCLCCFHSYGQDKSAKAKQQPAAKPYSANQAATPYKPAAESEDVSNKALDKKFEGYLILVKNDYVDASEDVPVPFRGAKLVAVKGNSKVSVLKFEDQKLMKQWAPAYHADYKVLTADKKGLTSKLNSLGATVSTN